MVQRLMGGPEFSIDLLCDLDGRCLNAIPRTMIESRGGESIKGTVIARPGADRPRPARRRGAAGVRGPCTVQAFRDPEIGLGITDVNTRFGGAFPAPMYAALPGRTYPELIVRMARGERIEPHVGEFRHGHTFTRWYWQTRARRRTCARPGATSSPDGPRAAEVVARLVAAYKVLSRLRPMTVTRTTPSPPHRRRAARPARARAPGASSCTRTPSLTRELDDELRRAHGLPLSSYDVLVNLESAPDRQMRMSELADAVLLSRSGLTRLVERLEREGLLERADCPSDARGSLRRADRRGHGAGWPRRARPTCAACASASSTTSPTTSSSSSASSGAGCSRARGRAPSGASARGAARAVGRRRRRARASPARRRRRRAAATSSTGRGTSAVDRQVLLVAGEDHPHPVEARRCGCAMRAVYLPRGGPGRDAGRRPCGPCPSGARRSA